MTVVLNGKAAVITNVPKVVAELVDLQRQRAVIVKSRNMQANRLQAIVAGTLGYQSSMEEKARLKKFTEAAEIIKKIEEAPVAESTKWIVRTTMIGIEAFNHRKKVLEKEMETYSKTLPVAKWVSHADQRGFGLLFLAIVIGETGDLSNYTNPGKLWKRLGCAPYTFDDKTKMGATWKSGKEGKLPSGEWEKFGYSPRRRSIAYLIGEGIVKQNGPCEASETELPNGKVIVRKARSCGPYRKRYDETKLLCKENHPDYPDLRCHRHGMLLATKLLLKNLWIQWNGCPEYKPMWIV